MKRHAVCYSCCVRRELAAYRRSTHQDSTPASQTRAAKWFENPAILDLVLQDPEVSDTMERRAQLETRIKALKEAVMVLKSIRH